MEALSVTPFADRAIDRGLTGVLVALVREMSQAYNGNTKAGAFDRNDLLADHLVRHLQRRAVSVTGDQATGTAVVDALDARLNQWDKERRVPGRRLAYDTPRRPAAALVQSPWRSLPRHPRVGWRAVS